MFIATAMLVVIAAPSPAAEARTRTVSFSAPFLDEGGRITGLGACGPTRTGVCDLRVEGVGTFTGALSTFVDYFGYAHFDPSIRTLRAETWDRHIGSLEGCGEGSFVMHQTDVIADFATLNPATGTFKMSLKWSILPGSGTGAFTGATGAGDAVVDVRPDFSNSGVYKGSITCRTGRN